jgi:glycosyltransferase involved in cell wall biosynthesis
MTITLIGALMRILSLSTHEEPCGIATYNAQLRDAIVAAGHQYDVFSIDTERYLTRARGELVSHFAPFVDRCRAYDAIVLQHEYGIYSAGYSLKESLKVFSRVLREVAGLGKPILIFFHTDPPSFPSRHGIGLLQRFSTARRSWRRILRVVGRSPHIRAVVHGAESRRRFIDRGFPRDRIVSVIHPFPTPAPGIFKPKDAQKSDIVLTIFGFLAPYKGYETALKALNLLPINYRLVIAGGTHPRALDDRTLDHILEMLGIGRFAADVGAFRGDRKALPGHLAEGRRVVITGWLDAREVRQVLQATDIVLAPYTDEGPANSGAATWGLSAGRPMIATRTRTFMEISRAAPCLRLVGQNAPFELAREILSLASDPQAQEAMVAVGRQFAQEHDWAHAARTLLPLLTDKA